MPTGQSAFKHPNEEITTIQPSYHSFPNVSAIPPEESEENPLEVHQFDEILVNGAIPLFGLNIFSNKLDKYRKSEIFMHTEYTTRYSTAT